MASSCQLLWLKGPKHSGTAGFVALRFAGGELQNQLKSDSRLPLLKKVPTKRRLQPNGASRYINECDQTIQIAPENRGSEVPAADNLWRHQRPGVESHANLGTSRTGWVLGSGFAFLQLAWLRQNLKEMAPYQPK